MSEKTLGLWIGLLFGLLASTSVPARNVALLIGVGRFNNAAMDQNNRLLGTDPDLDAVQKALVGRWQFDPKDVQVLRDRDATHERILAAIAALEQRSAPGDTVVLYYSGHGTSANDEDNLFDLPYATGAWIPYDFDPSDLPSEQRTLIIGRRDLVGPLARLDKGGRYVIVLSDSCYSGQVVRSIGRTHSTSRYLPLPKRDLGVAAAGAKPAATTVGARPPPPPYPYVHVVLLSGASDSESGADLSTPGALQQYPTIDGQYHGAFTDALLRLMSGQLSLSGNPLVPGSFSFAQGRDAVNAFLEGRHLAQHPQLLPALAEDKDDVGSLPFLRTGAAGAPSPGPAAAGAAAGAAATLHVTLEAVTPALQSAVAALGGVVVVARDGQLTVRQSGAQAELLGPAGDPILSAPATDPSLLKRIAAQAWLNRALPPGSEGLGLRAETDPGSRGNTFVECESFAFEVRLEKPAYVMLLDLDPQGGLTVLYPTRASERQKIPAGVSRAIPGTEPKDRILVTAPFGTDQVTVLAFEQAPNFLVELTGAQRFETTSGRAEFLAKGLSQTKGAVGVQQIDVHTYPAKGKSSCGP